MYMTGFIRRKMENISPNARERILSHMTLPFWTKSFCYTKARQTFVGRSLDLNSSVSVSSAEANIIVTSEEFIKKVVDRAMTSFVQSQLAPMLEPILSMIQSMHKAPMQLDVAEKVHGNRVYQ